MIQIPVKNFSGASLFHFLFFICFAFVWVCVVFGSDARACGATKVFSSLIEIEFGWGAREVEMVGTKNSRAVPEKQASHATRRKNKKKGRGGRRALFPFQKNAGGGRRICSLV